MISNVYNFSFSNISIANCTASYSSITTQKFALLVHFSGNVIIQDASFQLCIHTPVIFLNNYHAVKMENASFIENHGPKKYKKVQTSFPGALSIIQGGTLDYVNYSISSTVFVYNEPPRTMYTNYSTNYKTLGYGGAVFVEFGGNTSKSTLTFERTNFTNNTGACGGGVHAYFTDNAHENTINFSQGKCFGNTAYISGGGLNIGFYNSPSQQNEFTVSGCVFKKNKALIGGGLALYSTYSEQRLLNATKVTIAGTCYGSNMAVISPAVDITPLIPHGEGYLPVPHFTDCSFVNNTIDQITTKSYTYINSGVFFVKLFKVIFSGRIFFLENKYSAILLLSATAEFKSGSKAVFYNIGHNGGAISMISLSTLLLNPHSQLNFSKNSAIEEGGAIYVTTSDQHSLLRGREHCFIKNSESHNFSLINTTQVVFEDNVAPEMHGMSVYAESFLGCLSMCKSLINKKNFKFNISNAFKCTGDFTLDKASRAPLKSSSRKIDFYNNKEKHVSFRVYPGYKFNLSFNIFDDFNYKIKPVMRIYSSQAEGANSNAVYVKDPFTLSHVISPRGAVNSSSKFSLSVIGIRQLSFDFHVTLTQCPPGLTYQSDQKVCKCSDGENGYPAVTKCDDFDSTVIYKNGMWAGYIPEYSTNPLNLYFAPCVAPLCNDTNHQLPKKSHRYGKDYMQQEQERINVWGLYLQFFYSISLKRPFLWPK